MTEFDRMVTKDIEEWYGQPLPSESALRKELIEMYWEEYLGNEERARPSYH